MALWKHPGTDVTGLLARCEKVSTTAEKVKYLSWTSSDSQKYRGGDIYLWTDILRTATVLKRTVDSPIFRLFPLSPLAFIQII